MIQTRLTPFGISINADKSKDIRQLFMVSLLQYVQQYKIVVLRGFHALSKNGLAKYAQSGGDLLEWDFGKVMELQIHANAKNYLFTSGAVPLHWDGAFYQEPRFLLFHCIQAPEIDTGGQTVFINTENIWHAATKDEQNKYSQYQFSYHTEKKAHYGGEFTTKMVKYHPDTGKTILRFAEPVGSEYLNPVTAKVVGKNQIESDNILQDLKQKFYQPEFIYKHQWQDGDCLFRSFRQPIPVFLAHSFH